jgi:hypothetical protein
LIVCQSIVYRRDIKIQFADKLRLKFGGFELQSSLPSIEEIEAEIEGVNNDG